MVKILKTKVIILSVFPKHFTTFFKRSGYSFYLLTNINITGKFQNICPSRAIWLISNNIFKKMKIRMTIVFGALFSMRRLARKLATGKCATSPGLNHPFPCKRLFSWF